MGKRMVVAGVNSGTSADGIDVCIAAWTFEENVATTADEGEVESGAAPTVELLKYAEVPWGSEEREVIFRMMDADAQLTLRDLGRANYLLGRRFGEAVVQVAGPELLPMLDAVACHGQTVHHDPPNSTMQIGEPSETARITGVTVVSNFRTADVAYGGQGAPLTSTFDALLLKPSSGIRALLNIGGISNVTLLGPDIKTTGKGGESGGGKRDAPAAVAAASAAIASDEAQHSFQPFAYDTGPGNVLIDWAAQACNPKLACDTDGMIGTAGTVHAGLLADVMLALPYFGMSAPKTTGRELFSATLFKEWQEKATALGITSADLVATVTELTAVTIAKGFLHPLPKEAQSRVSAELVEVVVAGGGGKNPYLMERLRCALRAEFGRPVAVVAHDKLLADCIQLTSAGSSMSSSGSSEVGSGDAGHLGVMAAGSTLSDAKEAMLFSLLGYLTLNGIPGNIMSCTGASSSVVLGNVTPGNNYRQTDVSGTHR